jgi:hypothetical protein
MLRTDVEEAGKRGGWQSGDTCVVLVVQKGMESVLEASL